jgi:hypothetical protein
MISFLSVRFKEKLLRPDKGKTSVIWQHHKVSSADLFKKIKIWREQ